MKKFFALVLGTVAAAMFVSCTDNSKQNVSQDVNTDPATKGTFKLTLMVSDKAVDQQEIIKTVVTTHTTSGEEKNDEFLAEMDELTITPAVDFALPHEETITVTQTLKEGVSLTKDRYLLGLGYRFEVFSMNDKGGVSYSDKLEELDLVAGVSKDNIGNYKIVYNFSFTINAAGEITYLKKK